MTETIVILVLFFGGGNAASSQSIKFDSVSDCELAYQAYKNKYGSTDSNWFKDSYTIDTRYSGCLKVKG